jgi:hypothetical protein
VEFEVTKEPEGTRVFYQAPEKIKKGTVDAKVDFYSLWSRQLSGAYND